MLARLWVQIFGEGEMVLRWLTVLFGTLCIPAMGWLCREVFRSSRAVIVGAALMALSPFFVLYSGEAREYSLWTLFILLSTAALHRALRDKPDAESRRPFVAYGVYAAILTGSLYTSLSTASVLLVHALYVVGRERRVTESVKRVAFAQGLALLLFLPWGILVVEHWDAFRASMAWSSDITIPRLELLRALGVNVSRVLGDGGGDPAALIDYVPVVLGILLVGLGILASRRAERDARILIAMFCVCPIALMLLPDLLWGGIRSLSARYLIPAWSGILLAVTFGASRVSSDADERPHRRSLAFLIVVGLLAAGSSIRNATLDVVWTKGISVGLPRVADEVNREDAALVVGSNEAHHPGNMLALASMLRQDASMQFVPVGTDYELPPGDRPIFLFSPAYPLLEELRNRDDLVLEERVRDLHLSLFRIRRR